MAPDLQARSFDSHPFHFHTNRSHTCSVTKQYHSESAKGQQSSAAGKITVISSGRTARVNIYVQC